MGQPHPGLCPSHPHLLLFNLLYSPCVLLCLKQGIQTRYGADSNEFAAALGLVDKSTEALFTTLNSLYDGRVASAIAALNARDTSSERVKQIIHDKVARLLYDDRDFKEYYPVVYVRTNDFVGYARDLMCDALQRAVGSYVLPIPFLSSTFISVSQLNQRFSYFSSSSPFPTLSSSNNSVLANAPRVSPPHLRLRADAPTEPTTSTLHHLPNLFPAHLLFIYSN